MVCRGWLAAAIACLIPGLATAQPEPLPIPNEALDGPQLSVPIHESRPLGRWWFDLSFDIGWLSSRPAPQTVRLTPPDLLGRRIRPLVLPINGAFDSSPNFGLNLNGGLWLTENQALGLDFGFAGLFTSDQKLDGYAPGTLVYFPNGPDRSAPIFLQFPDALAGLASPVPAVASKWFATAEANLRSGLFITDAFRIDLLAGYRFAYVQDELYLGSQPEQQPSDLSGNSNSNSGYRANEDYRLNRLTAENTFHGGQVGLEADLRAGMLTLTGTAKFAYGGVTARTAATGAFLYPDMPLQLRTEHLAAYMPSLRVKCGLSLGDGLNIYTGYNFLYLSHASRIGDAFTPERSTWNVFWVHTLSFGFDVRF